VVLASSSLETSLLDHLLDCSLTRWPSSSSTTSPLSRKYYWKPPCSFHHHLHHPLPKLLKPPSHPRQRRCSDGKELLLLSIESQGVNLTLVEVGLFAVGDVVDGKSVAKGCPLGDLGEPGQQLWGSRRLGKRKGQKDKMKKANSHHDAFLLSTNLTLYTHHA